MCEFSIKSSNKIVEIYSNYILIIVPFEKPKRVWFTSKDARNWIEQKKILKQFPIDASTIERLDVIATTLSNKELGKPTLLVKEVPDNTTTKEQQYVDWVDTMVEKVVNSPKSEDAQSLQKLVDSAPPPIPEKVFIGNNPEPIVEHGNFMTIKRPHPKHKIKNSTPYINAETLKPTFKIILRRDEETNLDWIWLNNAQRLSPKQFMRFIENISRYIADREPAEEAEYRIAYRRLFVPGSIPVTIDDSLVEILEQFSIENKEILLQK